jgi:hypothetical protein
MAKYLLRQRVCCAVLMCKINHMSRAKEGLGVRILAFEFQCQGSVEKMSSAGPDLGRNTLERMRC